MKKHSRVIPLLLILGLVGCVSAPPNDHSNIFLGEKPRFEEMKSFQKVIRATEGSVDFERARIDYLLERLGRSPYNFIRNETAYSNARAVMHLRWKYLRYHKDAGTAEAFVDRVAVGSKKTGREYTVRISPSEEYPLRTVLHNELRLLDQGIWEHRNLIENQPHATPETDSVKKSGGPVETDQ